MTTMNLSHLAERVFDTPLLVAEPKMRAILAYLGPRMGFAAPEVRAGVLDGRGDPQGRPYQITESGVAIIPVVGSLVYRGGYMDALSGITSYQALQQQFDAALADSSVRSILMVYDTGGGEVSGAFDFADHIYQSRGVKQIQAAVDEHAYSAGYLLASAADRIYLPRTGGVGSIGVLTTHMDYSGAAEQAGVAVTHVYAGSKKVDLSPWRPLSERAQGDLQARVDGIYQLFVDTVARNRGISADAVRATQAGLFSGRLAVERGLADGIRPVAEVIQHLSSRGGLSMSEQTQSAETQTGATNEATNNVVDFKAELDRARTEAVQAAQITAAQEAQARAKVITEMCTLAHRPELAGAMIADGVTEAQARTRLLEMAAQASDSAGISAHIPQPADIASGWTKAFAKVRQNLR
jgi:signal peptide peptidase SppA